MPTPLRRGLRRAHRGAWLVLAAVLVVLALVIGVASQLLPWAERHPERIASWLGERAGRPVAFDRVETRWTRRGPLLRLDGLRIGAGADTVPIGEAEILVAQYAGLLPGRSFTELRLRGLALTLERQRDGRWQVRGLPGQQDGGDPLDALEGLGELQVIDGRLTVLAPALGLRVQPRRIDLRLRVDDARVRVATRAWMPGDRQPVRAVLDFDRDSGDGRAWLGMARADLSAWSAVRLAGIGPASGNGRVSAWATIRGHRVVRVQGDVDLDNVVLRGDAPAAGTAARTAALGAVTGRGQWTLATTGWRLDVPRLQTGRHGRVADVEGLAVTGGASLALVAERLEAGPALALLSLSSRVPVAARRWIATSRPRAVLRDVRYHADAAAARQLSAQVNGLSIAPSARVPGVSGIAGVLRADARSVSFVFDPVAAVSFEWPRAFDAAHVVRLSGGLVAWPQDADWQLATPGLRVDGRGYGADLRGGLTLQGDGSRPVLQLAADIDDAELAIARRFWGEHAMSPKAIAWLDSALLGGRVRNGRALVSGDLDDWPFRSGERAAPGLFRAEADIERAVVRFLPEWPPARDLNARVAFLDDSFQVRGRTRLGEVEVSSVMASIDHFSDGLLEVTAASETDASRMLAMLKTSPLRRSQAATLDNLVARGPMRASFSLAMPLHASTTPMSLGGGIELLGAQLADPRWKLAFEQVHGSARYDRAGFTADSLQVRRDAQPGRLSLRAGRGHVRDPAQAFEAELAASLSAQELLARAPQLGWLGPYLHGRSPWTIAVTVPSVAGGAATPAGTLRMRSNLVGTRLSLPAPLQKAATLALPTRLETRLPLESGEVALAMGERLALRARSTRAGTGVRIVLGGGSVAEAPPGDGLIATGRATSLDAIDWATLAATAGGAATASNASANGAATGARAGLRLQRIDLLADRLQLLGGSFPAIRVRAMPAAAGSTAIQLDGATLAGTLAVPAAAGASVSARLQRLHWARGRPPLTTSADARIVLQPGAAPGDDVDPSKIPPLDVGVDDLRFGTVALGAASFASRPVANGMRVERFRARTPQHRIDASGDWVGRGRSARTHLDVAVNSEDFGALLTGLGLGQRLEGGVGEARFDAGWAGGPAAFRVAGLEGNLLMTMKDGRLVQVEPGAGRVLGLLSLAELPRRLTLDFRDFFAKGFAFNRIGGNVRFAGGRARSDDLAIDGPAADIRIRGSADLRAQTFDQTIDVFPRTGNLLTAVGALTAGPVGAAVGAVANAVLRKPLGGIGAKTYRVTGPWKDPKVEVQGHPSSTPMRDVEPAVVPPLMPPAAPGPDPDAGPASPYVPMPAPAPRPAPAPAPAPASAQAPTG